MSEAYGFVGSCRRWSGGVVVVFEMAQGKFVDLSSSSLEFRLLGRQVTRAKELMTSFVPVCGEGKRSNLLKFSLGNDKQR